MVENIQKAKRMNRKETLETIGSYVVFIGTMIPIFFKNVSAIIWVMIVAVGVGFRASGFKKAKENHE